MSFDIFNKLNHSIDDSYPQFEHIDKNNNHIKLDGYLKPETKLENNNYLINKFVKKLESLNISKVDSINVDENLNISTVVKLNKNVKFKQNYIIQITGGLPEGLNEINLKFDGLCELICNKILINDLLGKGNEDFLKKNINIKELNQESILKSHLLNVYSFFNKMTAFLFGIYPDNIFSTKEQWKLVKEKEVNEVILSKGLEKIEPGTTLKLEIFKRDKTSFSGHSLLIKKTDTDKFIFFDPNSGEHRELSLKELRKKINEQLTEFDGTDIFITKGDSFIKRLRDKNIIEKATDIIKSQ